MLRRQLFWLSLILIASLAPAPLLWAQTNQTAAPAAAAPAPTNQTSPAGETPADEASRQLSSEEILAELNKKAQEGDPEAMMLLGALFERASIITFRNYGTALDWYKKAAAKGLAQAYYNVGICYEVGQGTPPDDKAAFQNYQKAAQAGLREANFKLGLFYLQGLGTPANVKQGLDFLTKAASSGYPPAQNELGIIYILGQWDQNRDERKAFDLFSKGAQQGFSESMKNLGVIFRDGLGRPTNNLQALKWFLLARTYGGSSPQLQMSIDNLSQKLKPAEVTAAEKEATAWRDSQIKNVQALAEAQRRNAD
ncbi:MAG: sel1 repeat family protein [Deltaproteobacteria bacterium]|jgi:TPR repeat protein|nr:sel1 repeat family protein [Deltaproteobacteria bacterium]